MDRTLPPLDQAGKKNTFADIRRRLVATVREYEYLLVAFTVPLVLMFLMYACRGIYPFGDSTVLVLDLNGQ